MPPPINALFASLDAHEERIQRLEQNQLEVKTDIAEMKVRLEGLEPMDAKLDRIIDGLERQGDRISKLEGSDERRRSVAKWIAGIVSTVIAAALLSYLGFHY